ncbi:MAG TPA: Crp/Fnr family transcriptional regulator [Novosphingobium sp.]|nr:Crp/Fnr family transcriptional regulator [Novosphingobium sp.]
MPSSKTPNIFSSLSVLPEGLLADFFKDATGLNLRAGEVLFRAGDAGDGCYRIATGLVKVVVASKQGEERIISLLGPGAIVGELSMIDGEPRAASVVAVADTALSFVSRAKFQKHAEADPGLMNYLVTTLTGRLREANEMLAASTFLSVKGRLARALLSLAEYIGEERDGRIELRHRISQGDLAAMAGIARENVSRTMSEWRTRNVVTRASEYYCINDPNALAEEAEAGG